MTYTNKNIKKYCVAVIKACINLRCLTLCLIARLVLPINCNMKSWPAIAALPMITKSMTPSDEDTGIPSPELRTLMTVSNESTAIRT
jgi:hypothetical protein